MSTPKILLWDIETSLLLTATFQRFSHSPIPYAMVFQEWFVISAQFKWLTEKKTHVVSLLDDKKRFDNDPADDYHIIKVLRDLLDEADIVIAHNGDHFDWKKFKAKLIYHKIKPPRKPTMIDTYKESKSAHFTSRKLGDLCEYLDLDHQKVSHRLGEWLQATLPYGTFRKSKGKIIKVTKASKKTAIYHISHEYGKYDIPALESLYKELRPYMSRHPNLNQYYADGIDRCTNCGSSDISPHGKNGHGRKTYICNPCGKKCLARRTTKYSSLRSG